MMQSSLDTQPTAIEPSTYQKLAEMCMTHLYTVGLDDGSLANVADTTYNPNATCTQWKFIQTITATLRCQVYGQRLCG